MAHVGNPLNFWKYTVRNGYDLTRPQSTPSPPTEGSLCLETTTSPITIDPSRTALLIIDMQNFFLSRALGRFGACHVAKEKIINLGIPAARVAGIQIIWLNWGLLDEELEDLPPNLFRTFDFFHVSRRVLRCVER